MRNLLIVVLSILLIPLMSCNRGEVFFKFHKIDKGEWDKNKYIEFVLDSLPFDSSLRYSADLELVYSSLYPYYDIWLAINHNLEDSISFCDTMKVNLIDDYGVRLGAGNTGLYQLSIPYKQSLLLDSASTYRVQVSNIMSDKSLVGITQVGLKVSEMQD